MTVQPRADNATDADRGAGFAALGLDQDLVDVLAGAGIAEPFPIQTMTIPDALAGRDVCGMAETGSGKTLAFGLPIIQRLRPAAPRGPRALVLVPTRELATQVTEALTPLAGRRRFSLVPVYGGVSMGRQIKSLKRGVEIVIATPGRLIDLLNRNEVHLEDIESVTIDEADQMADLGFLPQVRRIMDQIRTPHQTFLFSATLDGVVATLVNRYMTDPVNHSAEPPEATVDTMEHRFLKVHDMDKVRVAARIANASFRTLMFVSTRHGCDRLARDLRKHNVEAEAIHGNLHQSRREATLDRFASGAIPVLVATNVAARGLHVDGVDVVVHYDPPDDPKTYVHRSGRTARAGEEGLVVTLVLWDQVNEVHRIQKQAGIRAPIVKMFSNDDRLDDLAAFIPEGVPEPARPISMRRRGGRRRR